MTFVDDEPAARLFLSYHKPNRELTDSVVQAIQAEIDRRWPQGPHIRLWYDRSLEPGDKWDPKVQDELEMADLILFLITPTCQQAKYMWDDEFAVALARFREGQGRVRLLPILYSDTAAPIRTNCYTRGLNCIPRAPHDQNPRDWLREVAEGVAVAIEAVISQREPPALRLMPALREAAAALETAQQSFSLSPAGGYYGTVMASEINRILGAIEAALGLSARERSLSLSVWDPKLRNCVVRLRTANPGHSTTLKLLRDKLDDVATYSNDEDIYDPLVHTPSLLSTGAETEAITEKVRGEISAAREIFSDLSEAPPASTSLENEVREHTADIGERHAALAELILDEAKIDSSALSNEVAGVSTVARHYAETLRELGEEASPEGLSLSGKLSLNAARATEFTEQLMKASHPSGETQEDASEDQLPASPRGPKIFIMHDSQDDKRQSQLSSALAALGHDVTKIGDSLPFPDISQNDTIIFPDYQHKSIGEILNIIFDTSSEYQPVTIIINLEESIGINQNLTIDNIYGSRLIFEDETDFLSGITRINNIIKHKYPVFTDKYDEIIYAKEIKKIPETEWKAWFIKNDAYSTVINNLDSIYYKKISHTSPELAITLLIDNSGSMRGRPIHVTTRCCLALTQFLDHAGVKCEALGFTTRSWKGGKAREDWVAAGKPANPGRLADLRHIIYKSFDESFSEAEDNFGLMLTDGILKENIDGEALAWAAERIRRHPQQKKVLIILSDGVPVDDSTLSVNSGTFLDIHLRQTIARIEGQGDIQLMAIGIGHPVSKYYKTSVEIDDVEDLGTALAEALGKISDLV